MTGDPAQSTKIRRSDLLWLTVSARQIRVLINKKCLHIKGCPVDLGTQQVCHFFLKS